MVLRSSSNPSLIVHELFLRISVNVRTASIFLTLVGFVVTSNCFVIEVVAFSNVSFSEFS